MRWNRSAAALLVVTNAAACLAETPEFSNARPQPMQLLQGRLLGGQNWWARFGEPVNSAAMAQAEASPSDKAGPAGPMPMYGNGGYVYSPGACDYSPPCIWNLWGGYFSNPCRCHNHHWLNKHCGCNACGACGDSCNTGCGIGHHCHLFHKFCGQGCGCGNSCTTSADCGCAAPTCSTAADCGCSKPVCGKCHHCHLCGKWRNHMAHWSCGCDSCSSPLGCGCTTPTAAPIPASEKQATQSWPTPLPEEAAISPLRRLR